MRAVNNGNSFYIYDNSVSLHDSIPAQIYQINFDPRAGYSLSKHADIVINEKIYGIHTKKVQKVLNSFIQFERNLGVILSGDKGIGKSLFSKLLCMTAMKNGYPVLICNGFTPGLAQFIDSMDQELVILFDEFDKTFKQMENDEADKQASMLSLFDGISSYKKLFCVTCNNLRRLNDFLINRPGRFHYHFRFDYPGKAEIEEYMRDHLPQNKWNEIDKITTFAEKTKLNYDCLRAIAYELNTSDTFEAAIEDLNIIRTDNDIPVYKLYLCFKDGVKFKETSRIDMFNDERLEIEFGASSCVGCDFVTASFTPCEADYCKEYNGLFLPANKVQLDKIGYYFADSDLMLKHGEFMNNHLNENLEGLVLRCDHSQNRDYRYYVY